MKACPQCGAKNQEANKFCKKCGEALSASPSAFQEKKQNVVGKKSYTWLFLTAIVVLCVGVAGYFYLQNAKKTDESSIAQFNSPVASTAPIGVAEAGPAGKRLDMADIKATVKDGYLQFSLAEVKSKGLIYSEYQKGGKKLPMTAFITPKGKLVTAVSVCEPCRSTRFHIEGKNLVCNSCNTIWTLEDLKGLSGGCLKYPPDVIAHTLEGDAVKIKEADILAWKPRV